MIDLKQLSVDLSFKINDPVSDTKNSDGVQKYAWETDGKLFTSVDRLRFINQGISKLYMYLLNLQRDYRPKFVDVTAVEQVLIQNAAQEGFLTLDINMQRSWGVTGNVAKINAKLIDEIFITYDYESTTTTVKAEKIDAEIYASVYHGNNTLYKPSFKEKRIYWTLMGNVIHLLPQAVPALSNQYTKMMIVYIPDIEILTYKSSNYITQDYYLMLLILSALEAMVDMNNQAKFQLLTAELTSLFQLLGQVTQLEEAKDGK